MRLALNYQKVDPKRGGAETYVVDLCHRLVHSGHQVDLFAQSWDANALPPGVRPIRVDSSGWTRWSRTWSFARNSEAALRSREADYDCTVGLIHTWHHDVIIPQGGVQAATLEANSKRFPAGWRQPAYILGKRANPKSWIYRAIENRQYDPSRETRVVAVSKMVRDDLERYHGVAGERIDVIPNAIDAGRLIVADPPAARQSFRAGLGIRPEDLVALFVGHNYWLKGLRPLLLGMAERLRRDPSARPITLLACGGGNPRPFRGMVRDLGLEGSVHLLGFQPDIRPCFHASDFFALPTYYDPCSLVVFEALACGLPVVTTACNGAGELMTQGREGFVVPAPDDREALVGALDRMADDRARAAMSAHATKLGVEQSFDRHVARLVEVFERVALSKGRAGTPGPPAWSTRQESPSPRS